MNNLPPKVPKPPFSKVVINEPILNVDASVSGYLKKNYRTEIIFSGIFIALWEIIIGFFASRSFVNGNLSEDEGKGIIFLMFMPIGIAFVILAKLKNRLLHVFYKQFAAANKFTYQKKGWLENRQGAIFKVGHSANMSDIIQGQVAGLPLSLFNYGYTVGSGKNSQMYEKTILEIDLKILTPPILLLVDAHGFGDNISDNTLSRVSKIDLGGDWEKHFNLYTETKFEVEALQIFTPEFLHLIYDKYKKFSLDFLGQNFYVYSNGVIANKADLDLMLEFARLVAEKIGNKLPAMQSSISAMKEVLNKNSQSYSNSFKNANNFKKYPLFYSILFIVFGLGVGILVRALLAMFN